MILKQYEHKEFNKIQIAINKKNKGFEFLINHGKPNFYFVINEEKNIEIVYTIENNTIRLQSQKTHHNTLYIDNNPLNAEKILLSSIFAMINNIY